MFVQRPINKKMRFHGSQAELADALREMDREVVNQLPVLLGNQIRGMLGRDDVTMIFKIASELSNLYSPFRLI